MASCFDSLILVQLPVKIHKYLYDLSDVWNIDLQGGYILLRCNNKYGRYD